MTTGSDNVSGNAAALPLTYRQEIDFTSKVLISEAKIDGHGGSLE